MTDSRIFFHEKKMSYNNSHDIFLYSFYIMPDLLPVLHSVLQLRGLDQFRVP